MIPKSGPVFGKDHAHSEIQVLRRSRSAARVAGLALLAVVFVHGGYFVTVIGFAAIYGIFCTGLNFFMGYTGQASFGQNAFAALGGYGTAILCAGQGWQPLVALPRHHG